MEVKIRKGNSLTRRTWDILVILMAVKHLLAVKALLNKLLIANTSKGYSHKNQVIIELSLKI